MKVQVNLSRSKESKQITLKKESSVFDLLKTMNIKPDSAVVMKKNVPIPCDEKLKDNDILTILEISSSG